MCSWLDWMVYDILLAAWRWRRSGKWQNMCHNVIVLMAPTRTKQKPICCAKEWWWGMVVMASGVNESDSAASQFYGRWNASKGGEFFVQLLVMERMILKLKMVTFKLCRREELKRIDTDTSTDRSTSNESFFVAWECNTQLASHTFSNNTK